MRSTPFALLAIFSVGLCSCGEASLQSTRPPSGLIPVADGVKLYYQVDGHGGEPIVVIHGGPALSLAYLQPDLTPLMRSHTLIYYDQRGNGKSTLTTDAALLTLDKHIEDLEQVRRHFGIDHLALLGHSWGAGLAAQYAARYPQHVKNLLLIGSMPPRAVPYLETFGANLQAWMDEPTQARVTQLQEATHNAADPVAACRAFWAVFIRGYLNDPQRIPAFRGDVCDTPPAALIIQDRVYELTMESLGEWDWRELLRTVQAPTLVIHGDHDPIPLDAAREWVATLPHATLVVINRSGHFPFVEQPVQFTAAVEKFLKSNR